MNDSGLERMEISGFHGVGSDSMDFLIDPKPERPEELTRRHAKRGRGRRRARGKGGS